MLFSFQVGRIVDNSDAVTEILNNAELLKQIVYCIGGENLSVAKAVSHNHQPKHAETLVF